MSKAKGRYYEDKLVKDFTKLGYEAWKVPLSGAIGENSACKVPDRVRKYLIGDVCVNISGRDIPIEVKYRAQATAFKAIQNYQDSNTIRYFKDCISIYGLSNYTNFCNTEVYDTIILDKSISILNSTLTEWLDHCDVLALRSSKVKDWHFILKYTI